MIWIYCKTVDDPKEVGNFICKSNFGEVTNESKSNIIISECEKNCWLIKTSWQNETAAMIYRIEHEIVVIELEDICAPNVIESLMKKYGFDNVKWLLTN